MANHTDLVIQKASKLFSLLHREVENKWMANCVLQLLQTLVSVTPEPDWQRPHKPNQDS